MEPETQAADSKEMANLYCCEFQANENLELEERARGNPHLTAEYWKACFHESLARENFVLSAPLVALAPLLVISDLYGSRLAYGCLLVYVSLGITFLLSIVEWCVCVEFLRKKYGREAVLEFFTFESILAHSAMISVFLFGMCVISYYVAVGDRIAFLFDKVWTSAKCKKELEARASRLVPFFMYRVHSAIGVFLTYALAVPACAGIILLDMQAKRRKRSHNGGAYAQTHRYKIALIAGMVICLVVIKGLKMYIRDREFFQRVCDSLPALCLLFGLYGAIMAARELGFTAQKRHECDTPNTPRRTGAYAESLLVTAGISVILGVGWFTAIRCVKDDWFRCVAKE